jgi:hypothetical protein
MATLARNSIDANYRPCYAKDLRAAVTRDIVIGGVWPPADVTPELLGTAGPGVGADPATFIAGLFRRIEDPVWLAGS